MRGMTGPQPRNSPATKIAAVSVMRGERTTLVEFKDAAEVELLVTTSVDAVELAVDAEMRVELEVDAVVVSVFDAVLVADAVVFVVVAVVSTVVD